MDGILSIRKEKGWTSFDVVAKLRGILHIKKIGHTGTLDPDAEGVLPVCIGSATKAVEQLMDHDKEYETVLLLGQKTDTGDVTGKVLEKKPVPEDEEVIRSAARSFIGGYDQIPPMYSALKVNGKRLYEYAREGIEIEREPRFVSIPDIEILEIKLPRVRMRISCGRGTYIRALCEDIGEKAGTMGCMESLVRTRVGVFGIEDSHRLSEIEEAMKKGEVETLLVPVERALQQRRQMTGT